MYKIEEVTAGIDWLSMSMENEADGYTEWRAECTKAVERVAREGYTLVQRSLLGYDGICAGNCFIGENDYGSYCQITGEKANWAFPLLYRSNSHVSRIDVQLTAKLEVMDVNIGKRAYRDSIRANDAMPAGRKRKVWIIVGSDGGDTCYIGSASSQQRGRIYNKEVQSEDTHYTRCWRYEVVFRNGLATGFAGNLSVSPISQEEYALETVVKWFSQRGVEMGHFGGMGRVVLPLLRTLPTDVERKLKWLGSQVKPTIRYLIDLGFRDTLLELLFPAE